MAHIVPETADGGSVEAGSWGSIGLVCMYAIVAAASITKLMPLTSVLGHAFNAGPRSIGFAISLISVSSLVAATIGGVIIDRVGARTAIISASIVAVISNIIGFFATSVFMLDVARLIEGVEFIGINAAAPVLLMTITSGPRRMKAMSLYSTYLPIGGALGLLLAAPFAGSGHWRGVFALHGAIFVVATCFGGLLPKTPRVPPTKAISRTAKLPAICWQAGPLRLSLAFLWITVAGLGTSTVLPRYLAQTHHVSIAAASTILAVANLAWIVGSIVGGLLLARNVGTSLLYLIMTAVGMVSGFLLYAPWARFPVALAVLSAWVFAQGAALAVITSLLPQVVRDPGQRGAASGLMLQVMAVGALFTPPVFLTILAKGNWLYLVLPVLAGWALSFVFLPAGARTSVSSSAVAAGK
jgi:MFS family permease